VFLYKSIGLYLSTTTIVKFLACNNTEVILRCLKTEETRSTDVSATVNEWSCRNCFWDRM